MSPLQLWIQDAGAGQVALLINPPTGLTVTGTTTTTVSLSWTAPAAGFYPISFYNIYRNGVNIGMASGLTFTDSGLNPDTSYLYSVQAIDTHGNHSTLDGPVTGTTQIAPPVWGSLPVIDFSQGTFSTFNLAPYCLDPQGLPLTFSLATSSLPPGVTLAANGLLSYNGTSPDASTSGVSFSASNGTASATSSQTTVEITGAVGDWISRMTGAQVAISFSNPTDTTNNIQALGETNAPAFDSTVFPFGQTGSAKFVAAPGDSTQSGTLKLQWFGSNWTTGFFEPGQIFWSSFRMRVSAEAAYQLCPVKYLQGVPQGAKSTIIGSYVPQPPGGSGSESSHTSFNQVLENSLGNNAVYGYTDNNEGFPSWETTGIPFLNAGDYADQPEIDNSVAGTSTPDSVYSQVSAGGATDPDTGSAFTSEQIQVARAGGNYYSQSDSVYAFGVGHPLSGMMRFETDVFMTFVFRTHIGSWGSPNTEQTWWAARDGQAPVCLYHTTTMQLDQYPPSSGVLGYNAQYLTTYWTDRFQGGVSVASRSNASLAACTKVFPGLGSAYGAGTLAWDGSHFTWAEAGGSVGTRVGFNSWKLKAAVFNGTRAVPSASFNVTASIDVNGVFHVTVGTGIFPFMSTNFADAQGNTKYIAYQLTTQGGDISTWQLDAPPYNGVADYPVSSQTFSMTGDGDQYCFGKYLTVIVTNWTALAALGVASDTITLQQGRLAANTWFSEYLLFANDVPIKTTAYTDAGVKLGPTGGYTPALPGASALSTFLAGMSSNTWSPRNDAGGGFVMTGMNAALIGDTDPGDGASIVEYAGAAVWDPLHNLIQFAGQTHSGVPNYYSNMITYTDSTNSWANNPAGPPVPTGTVSHAYYLRGLNPTNGDYFWHEYQDNGVFQLPYGGSWTAVPSDPSGPHTQIPGSAWLPGAFSGQGGIVWGSALAINIYNPATQAWFQCNTAGLGLSGSDYAGVYDPASGNVYICGGATTDNIKVTPAGVCTRMANLPVVVGSPASGQDCGMALDGYVNASGVKRPPIIVWPGNGMWEYNSATDTWTSMGIVPPAQVSLNGSFCCIIPPYDGIMFLSTDNYINPYYWFFKRGS
jgi:Fibronectin type III domain